MEKYWFITYISLLFSSSAFTEQFLLSISFSRIRSVDEILMHPLKFWNNGCIFRISKYILCTCFTKNALLWKLECITLHYRGQLLLGAVFAFTLHMMVSYSIQNRAMDHVMQASSSSWLQEHMTDMSERYYGWFIVKCKIFALPLFRPLMENFFFCFEFAQLEYRLCILYENVYSPLFWIRPLSIGQNGRNQDKSGKKPLYSNLLFGSCGQRVLNFYALCKKCLISSSQKRNCIVIKLLSCS